MDIVFNYGIFDFSSDDFYVKFIHGETYYQLGIENYQSFNDYYKHTGRTVYSQELDLTQTQKQSIFNALAINYQPGNRYYLYNFVFDNCATRPFYLIKEALGDSILSDYQGYKESSFRHAISHYTGKNSWVDLGINMIFGYKANQAMSNEERLFLPEELMNYIAQAHLVDGTPLVKKQNIAPFSIAQVAWYANCWFGITLFAIMMLFLSIFDRKRKRLSWGIDVALLIIYILLFTLVIFLTYYSSHPLVGWNWRILILPIIHVCTRLVYIYR
jgi:hypothetical protein